MPEVVPALAPPTCRYIVRLLLDELDPWDAQRTCSKKTIRNFVSRKKRFGQRESSVHSQVHIVHIHVRVIGIAIRVLVIQELDADRLARILG